MFGFKRRQIQRRLPDVVAKSPYELGSALLSAFRGRIAGQQVCLYCAERGGFEMTHHPNCIVSAAADQLFRSPTPN